MHAIEKVSMSSKTTEELDIVDSNAFGHLRTGNGIAVKHELGKRWDQEFEVAMPFEKHGLYMGF